MGSSLSTKFKSFLDFLEEKNTTKNQVQRHNLLFVEINILNTISQRLKDIKSSYSNDFGGIINIVSHNLRHNSNNNINLFVLDKFDQYSSQMITNYIDIVSLNSTSHDINIVFNDTIYYDINNMNILWLNCYYQWLYVNKYHADSSFIECVTNASKLNKSILLELIYNLINGVKLTRFINGQTYNIVESNTDKDENIL